ncbi:hypothetical protein ACFVMC_29340 [Nocardia sp. NPDC127579]|uniref:hypothetical protein n=1 Tax=Nocardia sp. NPDC127579 TaxID=3345402 RepID=UPI00362C0447
MNSVRGFATRDLEFWNPRRWQLRVVFERCRTWVLATRRRRWTVGLSVAVLVLFVFPGILGAVATAQSEPESVVSSTNSALGWMDVKDSSGVELSDYQFVTDPGSVLSPGQTVISLILNLEFAGYMVIVTTAIWLVGFALSFRWLDMFGSALAGAAEGMTGSVATPMVLATAVSAGALCVGWFVVRGFHVKATMQVVTMVGLAIIGPVFLAHPLEEVLSSDGLLAQGRNVGIAVAAGMNGDTTSDPATLVITMQGDLADNFARRPLQVWNFGHVIDERPACAMAWSAGTNAGNADQVRNGLRMCGDASAYSAAENPTVGQIGAGLVVLASGTVLVLFAVYLSLKVMHAALDTIYHGFMSIFGFAAGGFIYGPTQTFLVRNVIDGIVAGFKMAAFTVFLGGYLLFVANLFEQARGQVMAVFIIGAIVELVAISQLKRLSLSIDGANDWISNRVALTMQGTPNLRGAGPGGFQAAIGMGSATMGRAGGAVGGGGAGFAALAALGAINTIGHSPITEWIMGKTPMPFSPYSRLRKKSQLLQMRNQVEFAEESKIQYLKLRQGSVFARRAIDNPDVFRLKSTHPNVTEPKLVGRLHESSAAGIGGLNTARGIQASLDSFFEDGGGGAGDAFAALVGAGHTDYAAMERGVAARLFVDNNREDEPHVFLPIAKAQAAMLGFQDNRDAASLSQLEMSVIRYRKAHNGGVTLDDNQQKFVRAHMADQKKSTLTNLQEIAAGGKVDHYPGTSTPISKEDAGRMLTWISNEHAKETVTALDSLMGLRPDQLELGQKLGDQHVAAVRKALASAADNDFWQSGSNRSGLNSPHPRNQSLP